MADAKKLRPKQAQFVNEYLVDLNATQAAIRAGYSKKTAHAIGVENLNKPLIKAAIEKALREREKRTEVTQDRVVEELAKIAFRDPRDLMSWGPGGVTLKDSAELTEDQAGLVTEISETTTEHGGSLRIKVADKMAALTLLSKHTGGFIERQQQDLNFNVTIGDKDAGSL